MALGRLAGANLSRFEKVVKVVEFLEQKWVLHILKDVKPTTTEPVPAFNTELSTKRLSLFPVAPDESLLPGEWNWTAELDHGLFWLISPKNQPEVAVGICGFEAGNAEQAGELRAFTASDFRGLGIMSEALRSLLDFGFEELGLNRIEALVEEGNIAGEQLVSRMGFQSEALLREFKLVDGRFRDFHLFSVLRTDFDRRSARFRRWMQGKWPAFGKSKKILAN